MILRRLAISNVRNLKNCNLTGLHRLNIIFGANGSGKTSMLEAIHFLGYGRPFSRSRHLPVIQYGQSVLAVFGEFTDHLSQKVTIGVERNTEVSGSIRIQGKKASTSSMLAETLPIQTIDASGFQLFSGSSKERRELMDWGVFHVKPSDKQYWQKYKRSLLQRNFLLKRSGYRQEDLEAWNAAMAASGEKIDQMRQQWLAAYLPLLQQVLHEMQPEMQDVEIFYSRGWAQDKSLADSLKSGFTGDQNSGYTRYGPHRADLRITVQGKSARDFLSRGQQKGLSMAMKFAQGILLKQMTDKLCLYLIDDLPAELDSENTALIFDFIRKLQNQTFITCIDKADLKSAFVDPPSEKVARFHVKQGVINPV